MPEELLPFTWTGSPVSREEATPGLRELQAAVRRGLLFGVAIALVELALLHLIAPQVPIGTPLLGLWVLGLIGISFIPFWRWGSLTQAKRKFTKRGLYSEGKRLGRWKDFIGWFPHPADAEGFVLLGRGGTTRVLRFPVEPQRSRLSTLLSSRLPVVPPAEAREFTVPIVIDHRHVLLLFLTSLAVSIVGLILAYYFVVATRVPHGYLLLPALTALIPAGITWYHLAFHYPQYQRARWAAAGLVWWFAWGLLFPLVPALIIRLHFPHWLTA